MKRLITAGLVAVALSACGVAGSSPTASAGLAGTSWTLVAIDGREPAGDTQPTLIFDAAGNVSGSAGCNTYTGTATLDGSSISFGPLGSTRMACPDPDVMAQETAFLTALEEVEAFALDSQGRLVLENGVVMVFEAATPGPS